MATTIIKKPRSRGMSQTTTTKRPPTWHLRRSNGLQILEASALARLNWLVHGFSTRPGGVSEFPAQQESNASEKVLNLGFTEWDSREHVPENRKKLFASLGASRMRVVGLRQIHSDIIHVVGSPDVPQGERAPQGDALITSEPGVLLVVQTADCIPILLADTKHHAVAAIHSGWRGTARRVAEKTLGRMQMEFGTRPQDVIAALGPGIGGCCYEVGHEVVKEFAAKFSNAREWFAGPFDALENGDNDPNWLPWLTMRPPGHAPPPPRVQLDLIAANRAILASAGVAPDRIQTGDFCTSCRTDLFFSYRRERTTGRMMAAIGIRSKTK
ncbi:MAG: peptidoglycan editing factor PgeF [Candidatus Acidiferrales bacterium]